MLERKINSTEAAKMGFLIMVAGYNLTDEGNESKRKVYRIKNKMVTTYREDLNIGESQISFSNIIQI
jgi:hypothetical protein